MDIGILIRKTQNKRFVLPINLQNKKTNNDERMKMCMKMILLLVQALVSLLHECIHTTRKRECVHVFVGYGMVDCAFCLWLVFTELFQLFSLYCRVCL